MKTPETVLPPPKLIGQSQWELLALEALVQGPARCDILIYRLGLQGSIARNIYRRDLRKALGRLEREGLVEYKPAGIGAGRVWHIILLPDKEGSASGIEAAFRAGWAMGKGRVAKNEKEAKTLRLRCHTDFHTWLRMRKP